MEDEVPLAARLKREPENFHDENAIAVIVKEKPYRDFHIGYLTRQVASELAPRLDAGTFNPTEVWLTSVDAETGNGELRVKYVKERKKLPAEQGN
jgi:hypothetical protein